MISPFDRSMVDISYCKCANYDRTRHIFHIFFVFFQMVSISKCAYCDRIRHRVSIGDHLYLSWVPRYRFWSYVPFLRKESKCFPYTLALCSSPLVLSRCSDTKKYLQEVLIPSWDMAVVQKEPSLHAFLQEWWLGRCACCDQQIHSESKPYFRVFQKVFPSVSVNIIQLRLLFFNEELLFVKIKFMK